MNKEVTTIKTTTTRSKLPYIKVYHIIDNLTPLYKNQHVLK